MNAFLATLLISVGLAPADARHEPCKMPAWAMGNQHALVCDFKDASAAGVAVLAPNYRGARTHSRFTVSPLRQQIATAILVSDRTVPVGDAPNVATSLGPWGGWVDGSGVMHGAVGAWTMKLSDTPLSQRPAGTVVYLLNKDTRNIARSSNGT